MMNSDIDPWAEARETIDAIELRELREARAAEKERRARLYRAARAAAEDWLPGTGDDPHVERLRRHAVDLALEEPAIAVHWLGRDSPTDRLVQRGNAVALSGQGNRMIMVPPIVGEPSYVTVLHEIGHFRAPGFGGKLQCEAAAWRYCRQVAIVWSHECQQTMIRCVNTYSANADRTATNLMGALDVERLIGSYEYAQERLRRIQK
jgi:hypothetical protein